MVVSSISVSDLVSVFRRNRMKITPQRQLLCSLIEGAADHPTVESIYQQAAKHMPTISLKTVYTTLTELADLGVIRLSNIGSGSLRVDPDPTPHAHLVCKTCGKVFDQPYSSLSDTLSLKIDHPGFTVEEQEVILRGRCQECLSSLDTDAAINPPADTGTSPVKSSRKRG